MDIRLTLQELYFEYSGKTPDQIWNLPVSGSDRRYYRIKHSNYSLIATFNPNIAENDTFRYFSVHFYQLGLPVPRVLFTHKSGQIYFQEDFGDQDLLSAITNLQSNSDFETETLKLVKPVLEFLPKFQMEATAGLDFSKCLGRVEFDKRAFLWDLNYFKYCFLKPQNIPFDEDKLESDFKLLANFLDQAPRQFFMYRDFQSRNIMLHQGKPCFIDFQGGKSGALPYDLISFIYQARAQFSPSMRQKMVEFYILEAKKQEKFDAESFITYFDGFVLLRLLQVLGAYGLRGYIEKKAHFLLSIPPAIKNIKDFLDQEKLKLKLPELSKTIQLLSTQTETDKQKASGKLQVRIHSFSYKRGIPPDKSDNGGGFVFDCRLLNNPGRIDSLKPFTGKEKPIVDFLESQEDVKLFLKNVFEMVQQAVRHYQTRNFTNLMVSFGCTGGQHRSVYCAEKLSAFLKQIPDIQIETIHTELESR